MIANLLTLMARFGTFLTGGRYIKTVNGGLEIAKIYRKRSRASQWVGHRILTVTIHFMRRNGSHVIEQTMPR